MPPLTGTGSEANGLNPGSDPARTRGLVVLLRVLQRHVQKVAGCHQRCRKHDYATSGVQPSPELTIELRGVEVSRRQPSEVEKHSLATVVSGGDGQAELPPAIRPSNRGGHLAAPGQYLLHFEVTFDGPGLPVFATAACPRF